MRLDQIGQTEISAWWDEAILGAGKDPRTGEGCLNALSMLFKHAAKTNEDLQNPIPAARARIFAEYSNTASSRARDEGNKRPLGIADLAKLLPILEAHENPDLLLTIVLMYE